MPDSWMPVDGEGLHALDETQQHRRGDGYGVVDPGGGACEVTVNSGVLAQSDTLTVASGDVLVGATTHSLATQTLRLDAASATNPRRDVAYVDASGAVQVAKGTAEAVEPEGQSLTRFDLYRPAPPDLASTDGTVLAEVWIPTGASSIQSADVRDRRLRALGPHSLDEDIASQSELNAHAGDADAHHAEDHDHTEAGVSTVPTGGLAADTVTVAGNAVTLGGSTAIAHGNLSGIGTDNHHAQDHDHTTASVSTVPNAGLANDSITVTGGDGLKNGGSASLGGSTTLDAAPADFAGLFLSDDGSDTLQVDIGTHLENDGSGSVTVDEQSLAGDGLDGNQGDLRITDRQPFAPGMTEYEDGLSNVEIARFIGQTGDQYHVEEIQFPQQGGGSSSNATLEVRDVGASTTLASATLGGVESADATAGAGNTVIVRITNSTGGAINAAPVADLWRL